MDSYSPREVAHVMWGLARMHQGLSPHVIDLLLQHLLAAGGGARAAASSASQPTLTQQQPSGAPAGSPPASPHAQFPALGGGAQRRWRPLQRAPRGELQHQHLANALGAIPWLLPARIRFTFGKVHQDVLRRAEEATRALLTHDDDEEGEEEEEDKGGAAPLVQQRRAAAPAGRSGAAQGEERAWAEADEEEDGGGGGGGWAACELLQVAQAFAALNHQPSALWLDTHQRRAARQWLRLDAAQQRRLVLCYAALGGAPAVLRLQRRLPEPAQAVTLCQVLLQDHDMVCSLEEGAGDEAEGGVTGTWAQLPSLQSACCRLLAEAAGYPFASGDELVALPEERLGDGAAWSAGRPRARKDLQLE